MSHAESRLYSFTVNLDNALNAAKRVGRLEAGPSDTMGVELIQARREAGETREEVIAQHEVSLYQSARIASLEGERAALLKGIEEAFAIINHYTLPNAMSDAIHILAALQATERSEVPTPNAEDK